MKRPAIFERTKESSNIYLPEKELKTLELKNVYALSSLI
jgi:hypothetical protein